MPSLPNWINELTRSRRWHGSAWFLRLLELGFDFPCLFITGFLHVPGALTLLYASRRDNLCGRRGRRAAVAYDPLYRRRHLFRQRLVHLIQDWGGHHHQIQVCVFRSFRRSRRLHRHFLLHGSWRISRNLRRDFRTITGHLRHRGLRLCRNGRAGNHGSVSLPHNIRNCFAADSRRILRHRANPLLDRRRKLRLPRQHPAQATLAASASGPNTRHGRGRCAATCFSSPSPPKLMGTIFAASTAARCVSVSAADSSVCNSRRSRAARARVSSASWVAVASEARSAAISLRSNAVRSSSSPRAWAVNLGSSVFIVRSGEGD